MINFVVAENVHTFATQKGALAHLARARHWQCRGERFESAVLHTHSSESNFRFAFLLYP